jgi:uncharacterized membrane protein
MDDLTAWIKFAHVISAATWFGGMVYVEALIANAKRTNDPQILGAVSMRVGKTNMRLFPAVGLLTLLFGIWLVIEAGFEWESAFVSAGLTITIIGLGMGIFFFMPKMKQIEAILASDGPGSHELMAISKKIGMATHFMAAILTIAMFFMVVQP